MHRTGLEPVTTRFEAGYSIQLSYRCLIEPNFFTRKIDFVKEEVFAKGKKLSSQHGTDDNMNFEELMTREVL